MKKINPTRQLLGLRQEEMAMLLGVSRSQWGMFEIGQRELPVSALVLLSEIETALHQVDTKAKPTAKQEQGSKQLFEKLLLENKHQQYILDKQIGATLHKQTAQAQVTALLTFFNERDAKAGKKESHRLNTIPKINAIHTVNHATELLQLELKKEMLEHERKLIEVRLKKHSANE